MPDITLKQARAIVDAARQKSDELRVAMNIAVVDAGANLKAFARMDGALMGAADVALRKARTAGLFRINTSEIGKLSQPGGPLYGIEVSNGGLITFAGGVPIRDGEGQLIGAVGVSGGSLEQDQLVAEVGARGAMETSEIK